MTDVGAQTSTHLEEGNEAVEPARAPATASSTGQDDTASLTAAGEKIEKFKRLTKSEKKALRQVERRERQVQKRKLDRVKRKQQAKQPKPDPVELEQPLNLILDASFTSAMSSKSTKRLVHQMSRVRGIQKRYTGLTLTIAQAPPSLVDQFHNEISSFNSYGWKFVDAKATDMCAEQSLIPVFLSPDATNPPLTNIQPDCCYVIGGLVDETGVGPMTLNKAQQLKCQAYRLPIKEHARRLAKGTFNVMLAINQVIECLCIYAATKSWPKALAATVPKRVGYVFDDDTVDDVDDNLDDTPADDAADNQDNATADSVADAATDAIAEAVVDT